MVYTEFRVGLNVQNLKEMNLKMINSHFKP